jgi:N-acetylglutamate synthase-like GNAT family acetyltransferase
MLTIRQAQQSDCDAMCTVQRAAIVHHYTRNHGVESAQRWAKLVRTDICQQWLSSEMVIVAEELDTVLGFAQFNGDSGNVEVSVLPDAEKRAIPAALLAVIETEARSRGLESLLLSAMLNSERLYIGSGFSVIGAGEIPLSDGTGLSCVRMKKVLQYAEPRPERRRNGIVHSGPTLT